MDEKTPEWRLWALGGAFWKLRPTPNGHIFRWSNYKQKEEIDGEAPETACENKETTLRRYFVSNLI